MDLNERIAAAKGRISETNVAAEMERYGITCDGNHYFYGEYRYDKLDDALAYAQRQSLPSSSQSTSSNLTELARLPVTVIGGSGWPMRQGEVYVLSKTIEGLELTPKNTGATVQIRRAQLTSIEISGPGTATSNAGIAGGGFGIEGAAIGMLLAGAINAATTRKSTNTLLRLATRKAEVFLHTAATEPALLRIVLSEEFLHTEALRLPSPCSIVADLKELSELRATAALTELEFQEIKAGLLESYRSATNE